MHVAILTLMFINSAFAHGHDDWEEGEHEHDSYEYPPAPQAPPQAPPQAAGRLFVVNDTGGNIFFSVNGQAPVALATGGSNLVNTFAGHAQVQATYRQFGTTYTLGSFDTLVRPDRPATLVLPRLTTARVQISNHTGRTAMLFVNEQPAGEMRPDEVRILERPLGPVDLSMKVGNEEAGRSHLELQAFVEHRFSVERPTVADIVVVNPFPMPIELVCDRGLVRTLPAFGRVVYENLPVGSFHLTARRITDEYIDDAVIPVQAYMQSQWKVDPPTTGLVALDNSHWNSTRIYVDGKSTTALTADQDRNLLLGLGWHQVTVRDSQGRVLRSDWVEVEAFDINTFSFGRSSHVLVPPPGPVAMHTPAPAPVPSGSSCSMPH